MLCAYSTLCVRNHIFALKCANAQRVKILLSKIFKSITEVFFDFATFSANVKFLF